MKCINWIGCICVSPHKINFLFVYGKSDRKDSRFYKCLITYNKFKFFASSFPFDIFLQFAVKKKFYLTNFCVKITHLSWYFWDVLSNLTSVITCPALTLPDNVGTVVHQPRSNGSEPFSTIGTGTQQTYYTGSEAIYSCVPGFNHSGGDLTRNCLSNGTWSGDPVMCNGKIL